MLVERLDDVIRVLAAERHDEQRRELQIRRHFHARHGDDVRLEYGIIDLAA